MKILCPSQMRGLLSLASYTSPQSHHYTEDLSSSVEKHMVKMAASWVNNPVSSHSLSTQRKKSFLLSTRSFSLSDLPRSEKCFLEISPGAVLVLSPPKLCSLLGEGGELAAPLLIDLLALVGRWANSPIPFHCPEVEVLFIWNLQRKNAFLHRN